jgi:hypothetical protein
VTEIVIGEAAPGDARDGKGSNRPCGEHPRAIVEHLKCWILPPPFAVTKAWSLPVSLLWYMQNPWLSEPVDVAMERAFAGDGTDEPPVCV